MLQVDDPGDELGRVVRVGGEERGLIHTDRTDPGEARRVIDEWGAVVTDRFHRGVPRHPERAGDLRDRMTILTDPSARLSPGPLRPTRP